MVELLRRAFAHRKDDVAFVHGATRTTYGEIAATTYAFARALRTIGLGSGDSVSILSPNRPEVFAISAAVQFAGGRYTPLNPYASAADQAFILDDSEARIVVYHSSLAERAEELRELGVEAAFVPFETDDRRTGLVEQARQESDSPIAGTRHPDELAVLNYSGGTTGTPKGIMLSHRAVTRSVTTMLSEWQLPANIRILLCSPLSHAAGALVIPTMIRGGTVHVHEKFDPGAVLDAIENDGVNMLIGVPTMLYALLDALKAEDRDISGLETFAYGSAPVSPARLAEGIERFGNVFMQHYAQGEAPMTVTMLPKEDHDLDRPELLRSCGTPTIGTRLALLDDEGDPVPAGEEGEICVQGDLVMDGYWKRSEETAAALRGGWLRTGDVAKQDDEGYVYIVDRKKDMIISGGFNVYSREVEDVLTSHHAVRQAAVIGVPDSRWGEMVHAVIVVEDGAEIADNEIIDLVRREKGAVHAPKTMVRVDSLPMTAVGKIDKKRLRAEHWGDASRQVN
ncbi:AMP-binding protein [Parasphingopyxis sp.]|uniref:AMP-binding protein n=1 Tax=Parasphingopyxis sp. TaxID=1920299 RepID=UPI0026066076|nr:AMP-binding protein [Parasphingopyxis sp.]